MIDMIASPADTPLCLFPAGYEEAAAQGLKPRINAARAAQGLPTITPKLPTAQSPNKHSYDS
jgi:hypothetical protein